MTSSEDDPDSGFESNKERKKVVATKKNYGDELERKKEDLSVSQIIFDSSTKIKHKR